MKNYLLSAYMLIALLLVVLSPSSETFAQKASTVSASSSGAVDVNRIIQAFSAKETEFRQALNNYAFKRDAVIQTIGAGGQITGEYNRLSQFIFDDTGKRYEKIIRFPMPTMTEVSVTTEDLEDLGGIQPFALEASKINQYNFTYVGKERIDELNLYVFDVAPKVLPNPKKSKERFFQGRIWVDDTDLQIVKVRGKGVPEGDQRFPTFETYREQIDGRYWFPTYTYADDELIFPRGNVVRLRMRVRYTDFARLAGKARIIETEEPIEDKSETKPAPASPPAKPKP